jgi:aminoglycoside phosphotransferase (APT) family kinase protein
MLGPDPRLLRRAGMWLSRFHSATKSGKIVRGEGLRKYVWNRRESFRALAPEIPELLLARLDALPDHLGVRVHADFTPHNLLIRHGTLAVIDFAGIPEFDIGSPWFDVACMVAGVKQSWRRYTRNMFHWCSFPVARATCAFLEGYGVRHSDMPLLAAATAVRLFTMIHARYSTEGRIPPADGWEVSALREMLSI